MKIYSKNIVPWLLFTSAAAFCLYAPFSLWAVNAEFLGKQDMGLAIFFSFTFPMAIYVSCAIALVSIILAPFYRKSNKRGSNILLFSTFVGILPLAYIIVLDVVDTNAV